MTRAHSMLFIVFFTVGCSGNASRTDVRSADDVAEPVASSDGIAADEEGLYEEHLPEDVLASPPSLAGLEGSLDRDDGEARGDDESEGSILEGDLFGAELVGASWESDQNLRVYAAVRELGGFGDRAVVPLAHFTRGDRHAVIAWPAVTASGDLAGTAVYGVCVEEQSDGTFESCGDRWLVNEVTSARASLEGALGGSDYEVVSDQTTSQLDDIGLRVAGLGNAFVDAASRRDGEVLFRTAQELLLMLPVHDLAFTNVLPQTLVTAARSQKSFSHMKTEVGDSLASITCKIDGEMYEVTLLSLTAERDGTGSNGWRIVDYW